MSLGALSPSSIPQRRCNVGHRERDGEGNVPNGGIAAPLLSPLQGHRVPVPAAGSGACTHITCTAHMHLYGACTARLSTAGCPELLLLPQFPQQGGVPLLHGTGCCQQPGRVVGAGSPFSHTPGAAGRRAEGGGIPGGRALWVGDPLGHLRVGFPSPVLWWGPPASIPTPKPPMGEMRQQGCPPPP